MALKQPFSAMLFIRITWGVFPRSQCLGLLQSKGPDKGRGLCACLLKVFKRFPGDCDLQLRLETTVLELARP